MKYKIIACINQNLTLGKDNELLYHIKSDLQNFKRITLDSVIIMGRNTYESLPKKPLPHRINIVITTDTNYKADGCIVVHSIEECIELCEREYNTFDCYVIGGGKIYNEFIERDLIDTMYITEVSDTQEGDSFFPNVLMDEKWRIFYRSDTQYDRTCNLKHFFTIYKENKVKDD